ncbi:TPA: hypothetical protein DE059_03395, partial [Candidatus Peribacteria bacterium]|nr:hypothetical protein [Candidatus Peribacteria bacterium]
KKQKKQRMMIIQNLTMMTQAIMTTPLILLIPLNPLIPHKKFNLLLRNSQKELEIWPTKATHLINGLRSTVRLISVSAYQSTATGGSNPLAQHLHFFGI